MQPSRSPVCHTQHVNCLTAVGSCLLRTHVLYQANSLCTLSYGDPTRHWLWQNPQWPNENLEPRLSYSSLCILTCSAAVPVVSFLYKYVACNGDYAFFSSFPLCVRERERKWAVVCVWRSEGISTVFGFRAVIRFRLAGSHSKHLYPESHLSSPRGFLFYVRKSFFV